MSQLAETALLDPAWLGLSQLHDERYLLGRDGRCAEVTLEQHGQTVRLIADVRNGRGAGDPWRYERSLRVELRLTHPTVATLDDQWTAFAFDDRAQGGHLLRDASTWLWSELWDDDNAEPFEDDDAPSDAFEMRQSRADIDAMCERMGQLALAQLDHAALAIARTLTPDVQFFAYSALLDDPAGRARQIIATCPALLSLASGLSPHAGDGAALLDGIRAGRKLNALIAEMLPVATRQFCGAAPGQQALALVRRAPSMPLRELMCLLGAPGIDINDLDACGRGRNAWLAAMTAWGYLATRVPDRSAAREFGSFISRYGVALGTNAEATISEMLDWVVRSGAAVPSRRTSIERVRRDIDDWHTSLLDIDVDPATSLTAPPTPRRVVPELVIEPLLTVGDLITEGRQMRHCVASLAPDAIVGGLSVFRATVVGTRVTVAVVRDGRRWRLLEASGFANASLDTDRRALLRVWAESLT